MADPDPTPTARGARGYQADAVDATRLTIAALGLVAALILVGLASAWLGRGLVDWLDRGPARPQAQRPPAVTGPALEPRPAENLQALRTEKRRLLDEYRWLDRTAGVIRIPIDRAMRRLVEVENRAGGQ